MKFVLHVGVQKINYPATSASLTVMEHIVQKGKKSAKEMGRNGRYTVASLVVLMMMLGMFAGFALPAFLQHQSTVQKALATVRTMLKTGQKLEMTPVLSITVYDQHRSPVMRYIKVGDLPTANFIKKVLLSNVYEVTTTPNVLYNVTFKAEDGSSGKPGSGYHGAYTTIVAGLVGVSVKVALGNGTTPPSIADYALENKLVEFPVRTFGYDANSTHMWVYMRDIYTATSSLTVSEIGLFACSYHLVGSYNKWILLFRDVIDPPITLEPEQSIEVEYRIYIRYA